MSPGARFAVFLSVVLGVWTAEHVYVGWRLLGLPVFAHTGARRALLALMVVGFVSYVAGRVVSARGWYQLAAALEYLGGLWIGIIFLLFAALLVVDALTIGGTVLQRWTTDMRSAAVVASLILAAVAWAGGLRSPRVVEVDLAVPPRHMPASGLRILQVSDLHLGAMAGRGRIARVVKIIDRLQIDVLAITGDLVDGDTDAVRRVLPQLARLEAPRGVFAILGNHEYYDRRGPDSARQLLGEAGFRLLENAAAEIVPGVFLVGVPDDRAAAQTGHTRADLARALDGVPEDAVTILLQHSPGNEQEAAARGVDLMLNGHTHGGQIWPFHHLVAMDFGHIAGERRVGGMRQVVSRGAGLWGPPMRLFAPSDVVLVTLVPGSEDEE